MSNTHRRSFWLVIDDSATPDASYDYELLKHCTREEAIAHAVALEAKRGTVTVRVWTNLGARKRRVY
jgi:hypothetical protein